MVEIRLKGDQPTWPELGRQDVFIKKKQKKWYLMKRQKRNKTMTKFAHSVAFNDRVSKIYMTASLGVRSNVVHKERKCWSRVNRSFLS